MQDKIAFDMLSEKTILELYEIAKELNIPSFRKLKKEGLIHHILELKNPKKEELVVIDEPKVIPVIEVEAVREIKEVVTQTHTPKHHHKKENPHSKRDEKQQGENQPQAQQNSYEREKNTLIYVQGVLEVLPEGYGFLRIKGYLPSQDDVYVSQAQVRKFRLMTGHIVTGQARSPKESEKYHSMTKLELINGHIPEESTYLRDFDDLIPIYPQDVIKLENPANLENLSVKVIDIFSPIGKGQRGLIVSPPKAGKTTLLKAIANSVSLNNPEIYLIALLIDERPEEVTDFRRSIKGEVVASTFDELPENHVRITELVLEKAKRLVQHGYDVLILLDSITRMGRAYNLIIPPSGRTLSGGLDPNAMHRPKRFFGAARNIEKGGSLTILATALVETGSRMDDVIFEEFKGTGNMELRLERKLAERRIFPAIDIKQSGTRKEELLLSKEELRKELILRRTLDSGDTAEIAEFIIDRLKKSKSNKEFLSSIVDNGN